MPSRAQPRKVLESLHQAAIGELGEACATHAGIPHRLHTTAAHHALPTSLAANWQRIRALHPDWNVRLYDNQDIARFIMASYGPATLALYQLVNPRYGAARADLFRYLCIYRQGGVYLDVKSTTLVPLHDWLTPQDSYILSQWDHADPRYSDWGHHPALQHISGGEYQQWFIAASAEHPLMRAVLLAVFENIVQYRALPPRFGKMGVYEVTGPIAYSLAIHDALGTTQPPPSHRHCMVERDGWLAYNCLGRPDGHVTPDVPHYSRLKEPVVQLGMMDLALFHTVRAWQQMGKD